MPVDIDAVRERVHEHLEWIGFEIVADGRQHHTENAISESELNDLVDVALGIKPPKS
jgi:hypothetical protein